MAGFVKGDVVVVPFPFSDLTQAKRRPALVLAALTGDDLILCQITSQRVGDQYAIPIDDSDREKAIFDLIESSRLIAISFFTELAISHRRKPRRTSERLFRF